MGWLADYGAALAVAFWLGGMLGSVGAWGVDVPWWKRVIVLLLLWPWLAIWTLRRVQAEQRAQRRDGPGITITLHNTTESEQTVRGVWIRSDPEP